MRIIIFVLLMLPTIIFAQAAGFDATKLLAEQGHVEAQYNLGLMYASGDGVPENDAEAVKWFRLAAEQGFVLAQHDLGNMYYSGRGALKNDAEAVKWYRLAAEQGYRSANFNLGVMYDKGRGVPENDAEAVKRFRLAAEQGHAMAQYNLALLYARWEGVPMSLDNILTSYVWMSVSAAQGMQKAKDGIERVKTVITNEQLAQGQALASKCFESNFKDCP